MGIAAFILGCVSIVFYLASLLPLMRFMDMLTLPLAVAGVILGILGIVYGSYFTLAVIGLILSAVAMLFGFERLTGRRTLFGGRPYA